MTIESKTILEKNAGVVTTKTLRNTIADDDAQFGEIGSPADVAGNIHGQLRSIAEAAEALSAAQFGLTPPDLANDGQSNRNTHTVAGTAEEISGDTAFTAGATIEIVGLDTDVYVGADAAAAQANSVGSVSGVPYRFTLDGSETTFHADAATGGTYIAFQVTA